MTQAKGGRPQRKPRTKRRAREEVGKRIIFRVSEVEDAELRRESGDIGMSGYIRSKVFAGGIRRRDELRRIASLHVLGRSIRQLADHPAADPAQVTALLGQAADAIDRLSQGIPDEEISGDLDV